MSPALAPKPAHPLARSLVTVRNWTFLIDLAIGTFGRDGTFHATQLQAKCASKYAPAAPGATQPTGNTTPITPKA